MFDPASFARVAAFAVVYAGIEYRYLNRYEREFPQEKPVLGTILPYHAYFLLPVFVIVSYTLPITEWVGNVSFLAVAEDAIYFAWRGRPVTREDWTANILGSFKIGRAVIPIWWIPCVLAAAGLYVASL